MSHDARSAFAVCILALAACQATRNEEHTALVLYPDPPDPPRMQFLRAIADARDLEPERSGFDELLFGARPAAEPFRAPYGTAVHDGRVYVCDMEQGVLLSVDLTANRIEPVELEGRARLIKPVNLAFASDGMLFVADIGRRQVVVLDGEFRWQAEYGPWGEESRPVDVDLAGDRLFVTDTGSACVRVLERDSGTEVMAVGKGNLRGPTNAALDHDGNLYVVDTIDGRVPVFDARGELLRYIGSPGNSVGNLARPKGIACLDELLFVNDAAFENCQLFDLDGTPLMFFGGPGDGPGCFNLPAGVSVTREGLELFRDRIDPEFEAEALVVVTNFYGARLAFYALGKSRRFRYPD